MNKIKENLLLQKRELYNYKETEYINRNCDIDLKSKLIKVVMGPRRAGKSFYSIHELKNKKIGYVNFDDEGLIEIEDYSLLIEEIKSVYDNPKILFFDEIQNLKKWELFINRLQRQGYNIVLSGSNSNLLSSELSTHLTGRYFKYLIFPFSFKEFIEYYNLNTELTETEIKTKFEEYLIKGGFPEPLVYNIDYKKYLKTLCDSIILKDIVIRHNIGNPKALENLFNYLVSNPAQLISYNSLAKLTGIKSVHTIIKYLDYLEETFLIFQLKRFSYKVKEQINSEKKIYIIDNGYISSKSFSFSDNIGKLYENIVAIYLKKMELNDEIELFYYQNTQKYETDFVITKNNEVKQLIQVSFDISKHKTKEREIRGLIHASKDLNCENLIILNNVYDKTENVEWYGKKYIIRYIPLWKYLLTALKEKE